MKLPVVNKKQLKPSYIIVAVIALLAAIFIGRVAIWEHFYLQRMTGSEREAPQTASYVEAEEVDEVEPTPEQVIEYTVAADKPRYFSIPSLGITNARIVEVGTGSDGAIETPYNIHDVGWYTESALPGANSISVMDAHGGALGNGIFRHLPRIQVGAEIKIEMGDGRLFTYTVADTATKPNAEANAYMPTAFASPKPGQGSLTLITCTGDWWLSSQTYSHRFFVRALLRN